MHIQKLVNIVTRTVESIKIKLKRENVDFIDIDDLRVNINNGWWILRALNTKNVFSLRIESYFADSINEFKKIILSSICVNI